MRTRIRFEKRSRTFDLSATSIDEASEWLVHALENEGVDKRDRLRTRLLFEEALLNMAEHYGEQHEVDARLERRQGRYRLQLAAKGAKFNPLKPHTENEPNAWSTSLFSVIDMHVQYTYTMGANVLRMTLPRSSWNPVLKLALAMLVGVLIGALGNVLSPGDVQEAIGETVLHPIADMWIRLLQAISGPVIFLTALTATFGTKRIADFGGSRVTVVARYFAISTAIVLFTLLCTWPLFPLNVSTDALSGQALSGALDDVLHIVPGNLVEPFSSANTPQLLLIAIATGYLLATMDSSVEGLKNLIQQLNTLGLTVAQFACSLVPFFVGLLVCLKIWASDTALLSATWIPLVLATVISSLAFLAVLLVTSLRFHLSPALLARKLKKPFMAALRRGTLDFSTVDDLVMSCKRLLGIDREFAQASLPQGLFLYMPTGVVGICVFVMFAAQTQHIPIDQMWIVSAAALSVVLAVATPPITGANLLSFVMAFSYLGISNDAFLDVMIFDIVFGVLCIAFDQSMLQMETIYQASRMGFLDEDALRMPLAEQG